MITINNEIKVLTITSLCSLYFIITHGFNLFIPLITVLFFWILKSLFRYYHFDFCYDKKNLIGYEIINIFDITKFNIVTIKLFAVLSSIVTFSNMVGMQILITILLIWMKIDSYLFCTINLENYILLDYKISYIVGLISLITMIHYVQLFNYNNNILNMIILVCHNVLYITEFDIRFVN